MEKIPEKFLNEDDSQESESKFFEKWKTAPTIELNTYEEWLKIADLKELRATVKQFLLDIMRKIPIGREEIGRIRFSDKSVNEYISFSADRDKLLAAKQLPQFIKEGKLGEYFESPKDRSKQDTITGYYPIYFNLKTPETTKKLEILIGKDENGHLFFDMFVDYDREKAQLKKGFKLEPKSSSP